MLLHLIALGLTPQVSASNPDIVGQLEYHRSFHSAILNNDRTLEVWLPPGYGQGSQRYPVLYMHDGQNVFDPKTSPVSHNEWRADETAYALIQAKLIRPIIIVGIDNAGADRGNEYLPTRGKGRNAYGGKGADYAQFLLTEVKGFVDKSYRTKTGRNDTAVCGSSFGGVATWTIGVLHSDRVSKLAMMSPSIWWDDRVILKRAEGLKAKLPLQIWIDTGTHEGGHSVGDVDDFASALEKKGWVRGVDLFEFLDYGAEHTETAWTRRFGMMLMTFFPREARRGY